MMSSAVSTHSRSIVGPSGIKTSLPSDREIDPLELAGYVFLRSAMGQPIKREALPTLRKANKTLIDSKILLSYGRGNVRPDLISTKYESYLRTQQVKNRIRLCIAIKILKSKKTSSASSENIMAHAGVAFSILAESANCGGHAGVNAYLQCKHFATENENAATVTVRHREQDHNWCEIRNLADQVSGSNIVIDAWSEGPAIEARDGTYTARGDTTILHQWHTSDATSVDNMISDFQGMRQSIKVEVDKRLSDNVPIAPSEIHNPENVLSMDFRKAAAAVLDRSKPEKCAPRALQHALIATGAGMRLGLSVREAARQSDAVVISARKMIAM